MLIQKVKTKSGAILQLDCVSGQTKARLLLRIDEKTKLEVMLTRRELKFAEKMFNTMEDLIDDQERENRYKDDDFSDNDDDIPL